MINYCLHNSKKLISIFILPVILGVSFTLYIPLIFSATDTTKSLKIDEQQLIGRWVRPDGGYILELKKIGKNGELKVAYFNPKPIKVFKADWSRKQGVITIFVELRDINYPGSKYSLKYEPKTDRLMGTYFQAVHRETYDIEFIREKK